jgi:hypothetical protein
MLSAEMVKAAERSGASQAALTITSETYNRPFAEKAGTHISSATPIC